MGYTKFSKKTELRYTWYWGKAFVRRLVKADFRGTTWWHSLKGPVHRPLWILAGAGEGSSQMANAWHQGSVVLCKQQKVFPMFTTQDHTLLQTHRKGSPQDGRTRVRMALRVQGVGRSPRSCPLFSVGQAAGTNYL